MARGGAQTARATWPMAQGGTATASTRPLARGAQGRSFRERALGAPRRQRPSAWGQAESRASLRFCLAVVGGICPGGGRWGDWDSRSLAGITHRVICGDGKWKEGWEKGPAVRDLYLNANALCDLGVFRPEDPKMHRVAVGEEKVTVLYCTVPPSGEWGRLRPPGTPTLTPPWPPSPRPPNSRSLALSSRIPPALFIVLSLQPFFPSPPCAPASPLGFPPCLPEASLP